MGGTEERCQQVQVKNMNRYVDKLYDYLFHAKSPAEEWKSWHQRTTRDLEKLKESSFAIPRELSDVTEIKYYSWLSDELAEVFRKERAHIHKLAEVGCGSGALSFYFSKQSAAESTLIDNSDVALEYASLLFSRGGGVKPHFVKGDVFHGLPMKDDSFDFVHSTGLVEHFLPKDISVAMKEMKRIVRKGGYIFLAVPNYFSPDMIYIWSKHGKGAEKYLSVRDLRSFSAAAQLEVVRAGHCRFVFSNTIGRFIPSAAERRLGLLGFGFLNYVVCKKR